MILILWLFALISRELLPNMQSYLLLIKKVTGSITRIVISNCGVGGEDYMSFYF